MSRKPSVNLVSVRAGVAAIASMSLGSATPDDDICPVCKTMRYLNKDMEFLINPECYHPMCSGCVNRIFGEGPNQCPYAGCHKTLRRKNFHAAYFGDLTVEREVDIRRRVSAVFNKVEDDFETLQDYNGYLEMVEDLAFALINGPEPDRKKAERDLMEWEQAHKAEIERNKRMGREADENARRRLEAEEEAARQRKLRAMEEDQEEKRKEQLWREEMLDGLTNSETGHATQAVNRILLKKRGQARQQNGSVGTSAGAPSLSIRGLKEKKRPVVDDKPYDPFGGLDLQPSRYNPATVPELGNEWLNKARLREDMRTGGYNVDDYLSRAMFEAFSGLAVFISDEKPGEQDGVPKAVEISTKMDVDDVF
jgi:CDK-activating kinase assembly factor MAT1